MKLVLPYPIKYHSLNQDWGHLTIDPKTGQSIYKPFGFTFHNGIDVPIGIDKTVRSEVNGEVYKIANQYTGGGIYISIISNEMYEFEDGKSAYVLIDYLHLEKTLAFIGQKVNIGDKLAVQDNTGFSTGPHTHIQYRRVLKVTGGLQDLDINEANNSFDPEPFRNNEYAADLEYKSLLIRLRDLLLLFVQMLNSKVAK